MKRATAGTQDIARFEHRALLICPHDLEKAVIASRMVEHALAWSFNWFAPGGDHVATMIDHLLDSNETPSGLLRWRIALRDDGRRDLPRATLIEWGEAHPADSLPASGVRIVRLDLGDSPPRLVATLAARRGTVTLRTYD